MNLELWLGTKAENSQRAYTQAIRSFEKYTGAGIEEATKQDIVGWKAWMILRQLERTTINQRVAALSSYFRFCQRMDVRTDNPADIDRLRVVNFSKAVFLDAHEVSVLLREIKERGKYGSSGRVKVRSLQDYALFLGYILLGRRNSEWRRAQVSDFIRRGDGIYYRWHGKGKEGAQEVPPPLWQAVMDYTGAMNLLIGYLFTAMTENALRLPNVRALPEQIRESNKTDSLRMVRPISMGEVNRRLHYYASRAGVDIPGLRVHSLRHTAATLRRAAGMAIDEVNVFMDHESLDMTKGYVHMLEGKKDETWKPVCELLNIHTQREMHREKIYA